MKIKQDNGLESKLRHVRGQKTLGAKGCFSEELQVTREVNDKKLEIARKSREMTLQEEEQLGMFKEQKGGKSEIQ